MSLDVYLEIDGPPPFVDGECQIFVREDGSTRRIPREEWDRRHPGRKPVMITGGNDHEAYSGNITHNLNTMAEAAGIYRHLWRPEEVGIERASQLIEPLTVGLARLRTDPDKFRRLNPKNGWGTYEGLVQFVDEYLTACRAYPSAAVRVWR